MYCRSIQWIFHRTDQHDGKDKSKETSFFLKTANESEGVSRSTERRTIEIFPRASGSFEWSLNKKNKTLKSFVQWTFESSMTSKKQDKCLVVFFSAERKSNSRWKHRRQRRSQRSVLRNFVSTEKNPKQKWILRISGLSEMAPTKRQNGTEIAWPKEIFRRTTVLHQLRSSLVFENDEFLRDESRPDWSSFARSFSVSEKTSKNEQKKKCLPFLRLLLQSSRPNIEFRRIRSSFSMQTGPRQQSS